MSRINYLQELKGRFEAIRAEVADYKPEAFEHLEKRFYELYENSGFRYFVKRDLNTGKCPVNQWLEVNHYPINANEKKMLQSLVLLTEDSGKKYVDLISKYLFKYKNSQAFREDCDSQRRHGLNSLAIWFDKNGFEPIFKEGVI